MFSNIKKAIELLGGDSGNTGGTSAAGALEWGAFAGVRPEHIKQMDLPKDKVLPEDGLVNAKCEGANLADCYVKVGREERPLDAYLLGLSDTELSKATAGMIYDTNTVWSSRESINVLLQQRMAEYAVEVYNRNLPGLNLTNTCIPSMPLRPTTEDLGDSVVWQPTPQGLERFLSGFLAGVNRVADWCRSGVAQLLKRVSLAGVANQDGSKPEASSSHALGGAGGGQAEAEGGAVAATAFAGTASHSTGRVDSSGSAAVPPAPFSSVSTAAPTSPVSTPAKSQVNFISPFHAELYNNAKADEEQKRKNVAKGSPMMGTKDYPHLQSRLYDASNLPPHRQVDPELVADTSADTEERRRKAAEQSLFTFEERSNIRKVDLHKDLAAAEKNNFYGVNDPEFQERVRLADAMRATKLLEEEKRGGRIGVDVADMETLWERKREAYSRMDQNIDPYDFIRRANRIEAMPLPALQKEAAHSPGDALASVGFNSLAQAVENQSLPSVLQELECQVRLLTRKQLEIQAKFEHGVSQLEMLSTPNEMQRRVTMYKGGYDELTANYRELLQAEVEFVFTDFLDSHFKHKATLSPLELAYLQRAKEFFKMAPVWEQDKLDDIRMQAANGDTLIINEKGSADQWWVHGFMPITYHNYADSQIEQARAAGEPYKNAFGFVVDKSQLIEEATEFSKDGRWLVKDLDPLGLIGMHFYNYAAQMPLMTNRFNPLYLHIGANERERYQRPQFYTELGSLMGKTVDDAKENHAMHAYRSWDIARHSGVPASLWNIMEHFASISRQSAEFYLGCRYSVCMNKQLELGLPAAYVDYFARAKDGRRLPQSESEIPDGLRKEWRYRGPA